MAQESSEEGKRQPDVRPLGAEELYRQYLRLRAERDRFREGLAPVVTDANNGQEREYSLTPPERKKTGMNHQKTEQVF
jgi:hypothetical protein